jgi:hypothetical protein
MFNKMCPNKAGTECYYTSELAEDLLHLHNIEIEKLFANIYATKFSIEKRAIKPEDSIFNRTLLEFRLITDDKRDEPITWTGFYS